MDPKVGALEIFAIFKSHHIFSTFSPLILRRLNISRNSKLHCRATGQSYTMPIKLFTFLTIWVQKMQLNKIGIRRKQGFSEKTWNNFPVSKLPQSISPVSYLPFFPEHRDIRHVARRLWESAFFRPQSSRKKSVFRFFRPNSSPKTFLLSLLVSIHSPWWAESNGIGINTLSPSNKIIVLAPLGGYQY